MNRKKDEILKNSVKLKADLSENLEINSFITKKIEYFQEIIRKTIFSIQSYKKYELFSNSDVNICINTLNEIYSKTNEISDLHNENNNINNEKIIDMLQLVVDKLSVVICSFGTYNFEDLLFICFGSEFKNKTIENTYLYSKFELIQKYIHPIGYKTVYWKTQTKTNAQPLICSNKLSEETVDIENADHFECFDINLPNFTNFYNKVYGIRVVLQIEKTKKTLIINGIVDDIMVDCISNKFIHLRKKEINELILNHAVEPDILKRIIETMTLKDFLIYGNLDIYKKYTGIFGEINEIKQKKIDNIIKTFLDLDTYSQRNILINLLLYNKNDDVKYITYLLYDLITTNQNDICIDKITIYDSLPWKIKSYFKDVVIFTMKYTQEMINKYDTNKISLEQQIYMLKGPENIKEKAMTKLKELKGKPDDSGNKAKQYLEGLLKIPFGIYKEEPILKYRRTMNQLFNQIIKYNGSNVLNIPEKNIYTNIEILKYSKNLNIMNEEKIKSQINSMLRCQSVKTITNITNYIQSLIKNNEVLYSDNNSIKKKEERIDFITRILATQSIEKKHYHTIYDILYKNTSSPLLNNLLKVSSTVSTLESNITEINESLQNISKILDDSAYGHEHAKNQILKVIGQWMSGEQDGYCFGFEGSPGVGKTSLAKNGLAKCLLDEQSNSRPFAFIAIGGSCNGSTLEGHSYTYVNSTWGRITDILMETKCMNPIIYIDELDKVSKTEQGREIIGILTHLIDSTQNDSFQDKYFSGINLDLSKALFIFSYNDPEQIDHILLDRIHRIRFDNLSLSDKIIIVREYILPEINKKMGFSDTVILSDDIIEYIVETYTLEPGVRKLKEILFDLYGEINIELLKCNDPETIEIPMRLQIQEIDDKYLKKYYKINETKIHQKNEVGIISGLWANALGKGGIIPIETMFFPSASFLELRLTGLQGDVMKESMNVAKSLAWTLTPAKKKTELLKYFKDTKCQGLHIHCPQGAVSKDGPSAGTAITVAIYSLFNDKKIKNTIAITGEITLQGKITAIGGLNSKILGGIKAGVKTFLYPKENEREFNEFMEKYSEKKSIFEGITFIEISDIRHIFQYIFE
jgi:ATP-dependent Lon protease